MGLDQSLYKRGKNEDVEKIYWRKANFVHRYFTKDWEERGFETDNVTEFPASKSDLEELLGLCKAVLEDNTQAVHLLPTMRGFFFGSIDYDEWYFNDVEYTKDKLEQLLEEAGEDDEFYYYAWY